MNKFMLSFFALILAVLCPFNPLAARQISPLEAYGAAQQLIAYENQHASQRLTKATYTCARVEALAYQGQPIGYVVYMQPYGFMIMSGWSEDAPQKFVSFSGEYTAARSLPMLQAISARMHATAVNLQHAANPHGANSGKESGEIYDQAMIQRNQTRWDTLLGLSAQPPAAPAASEVQPLVTSRWYQAYPYNMYTPVYQGKPTYSGCSATAMTQIMYYWKYPARGRGSHTYLWYLQNIYLSADFNHDYNWLDMIDAYDSTATEAQKDAVARLMSDVGIAINMQYSPEGSGAEPNYNNAFFQFFKYDRSAGYVYREDYSTWTDWFDVFKGQLDLGRPVCMTVNSVEQDFAHAVVADGYRTAPGNQVHINMGWSGMDDNYYDLNYIHVTVHHDKVLLSEAAVINIFPMPPFSVQLSAQREREHSWLFSRDYAILTMSCVNPAEVAVARYDIYRKKGAGAYSFLASVQGSAVTGVQFTYSDKFLDHAQSYTYQVRAIDNSGLEIATSDACVLN